MPLFATVPLYGGAMQCEMPVGWMDASQVRQLPDHQEVYVHASTDQSLIIELLERVAEPDEQAIIAHYDEVARCNDAQADKRVVERRVLTPAEVPGLGAAASHCEVLVGEQGVSKFNETVRNRVQILFAILRLEAQGTDVLVSLNTPAAVGVGSSSAGVMLREFGGSAEAAAAHLSSAQAHAMALFSNVVRTMRVNNWGLFG